MTKKKTKARPEEMVGLENNGGEAMTTRTIPEWPEATWKFDEPITYFFYSICSEGVRCETGRSAALVFGRYAQHPRSISVYLSEPPPKRGGWSRQQEWPGDGWLVIARGWHERRGKERIEHRGGATIYSGEEPIRLEDFNEWLVREKLELLVDLRDAAIAEGWGPCYAGGACDPPTLPPLHLAHWYPERTCLTCAPNREEWTRYRQEFYIDHDYNGCDVPPAVSYRPSDYDQEDYLGGLILLLKHERSELAKKQKEAKRQFPHLFQRKGETKSQWSDRWYKMTTAEHDQIYELDTSSKRQVIFHAVKALEQDTFPDKYEALPRLPEVKLLFDRLEQAEERRRNELLAKAARDFPTDDAAWEQELESRRKKEEARQEQLRAVTGVAP